MNNHFRPSGRKINIDQAISFDLIDKKFLNYQFQRLVASRKNIKNCNFSYSTFDSSYLRNCTFDSCNFTGCDFIDTNFRGSVFVGCNFEYAKFTRTYVDPEILDTGCPGRENLQQIFARSLRINYQQIGDTVATNKAIRIELDATRVHLYKAWRSRESYYRKKYSGLKRGNMLLRWLSFVSLDFLWGNGESPIKLFRSLVLLTIMIAFGEVYFLRDAYVLESYTSALLQAPNVLLGIANPKEFSSLILTGIASLRYILFACLVSILIKRMSRR